MSCSKVYFTDFRSYHEEALTHKLQRLMDKAGLGQLDMDQAAFWRTGQSGFSSSELGKSCCGLCEE